MEFLAFFTMDTVWLRKARGIMRCVVDMHTVLTHMIDNNSEYAKDMLITPSLGSSSTSHYPLCMSTACVILVQPVS